MPGASSAVPVRIAALRAYGQALAALPGEVPWEKVATLVDLFPTIERPAVSPAVAAATAAAGQALTPVRRSLGSGGGEAPPASLSSASSRPRLVSRNGVSTPGVSADAMIAQSAGSRLLPASQQNSTTALANLFYCEAVQVTADFLVAGDGEGRHLDRVMPRLVAYLDQLDQLLEMSSDEAAHFVYAFLRALLRVGSHHVEQGRTLVVPLLTFLDRLPADRALFSASAAKSTRGGRDSDADALEHTLSVVMDGEVSPLIVLPPSPLPVRKTRTISSTPTSSAPDPVAVTLAALRALADAPLAWLWGVPRERLGALLTRWYALRHEEVEELVLNIALSLSAGVGKDADLRGVLVAPAQDILHRSYLGDAVTLRRVALASQLVLALAAVGDEELQADAVEMVRVLTATAPQAEDLAELEGFYQELLLQHVVAFGRAAPGQRAPLVANLKTVLLGEAEWPPALTRVFIQAFSALVGGGLAAKPESSEELAYATSVVNSLSNTLYAAGGGETAQAAIVVQLLGQVVVCAHNKHLTALLLPVFQSRFCQTDSPLNLVLLGELTAIASLGPEHGYGEIIDAVVAVYRTPYSPPHRLIVNEVPQALEGVARALPTKESRLDLLSRLLVLFAQLGYDVQELAASSPSSQPSSLAGRLGYLLPALAVALHRVVDDDLGGSWRPLWREGGSLLRKLRAAWYYCVLYGFVLDELWSIWHPAVQRIALCMPVLVGAGGRPYSQVEWEMELAALSPKMSDQDVAGLRQSLSSLLPGSDAQVGRLSVHQVMYLLSLYHLESLRLRSGQFGAFFAYVRDSGVAATPEIQPLVLAIGDLLVARYVAQPSAEDEVEGVTVHFLVDYCHRLRRVRELCDRYLIVVLQRFRFLFWSPRCLRTLLDLLTAVGASVRRLEHKPEVLEASLAPGGEVEDFERVALDLPDDLPAQQRVLQSLLRLCSLWCVEALLHAPQQTRHLLSQYVELHTAGAGVGVAGSARLGVSFAVEMASLSVQQVHALKADSSEETTTLLSAAAAGTAAVVASSSGAGAPPSEAETLRHQRALDTRTSDFLSTLQVKRKYLGELTGVAVLIDHLVRLPEQALPPALAQVVKATGSVEDRRAPLRAFIEQEFMGVLHAIRGHQKGGGEVDVGLYHGAMLRAAALLASDASAQFGVVAEAAPGGGGGGGGGAEDLWKMLCWTPVLLWTEDAMQTALFCWSWVLACRPDLELSLMRQVRAVWIWSVDERLGLFSQEGGAVTPHRLWLTFLLERWQMSHLPAAGELAALFRSMVHAAVVDTSLLCLQPSALPTRAQLMLLAVRVATRTDGMTTLEEALDAGRLMMHTQIIQCGLAWFSSPPAWYDAESRSQLAEDVQILIDTWRRVKHESKRLAALLAELKPVRRPPSMRRLGSQASSSVGSAAGQGSFSTLTRTTGAGAVATPTRGRRLDWGWAAAAQGQEAVQLQRLADQVSLLALLLASEVDHVVVWHNPLGIPAHRVADESLQPYAGRLAPHTAAQAVRTAWDYSPRVALQLAVRFPGACEGEVERLVRRAAPLVVQEPGAVRFLLTQRNVERGVPELRHLLYWAPSHDLLSLLALLVRPFADDPYVAGYVCRCLAQFPPGDLLYHIPQLVQGLRYDRHGGLRTLLKRLAASSQVFGTQLVWNLYTEEHSETALTGDALLGVCASLRQEVLGAFPPALAQLHDEEFRYFERVTAISGVLKPLPAEERRARIEEELRAIPLSTHIYLPTDPHRRVVGVKYDSGIPLKSHAKVPIMVTFLVAPWDPTKPASVTETPGGEEVVTSSQACIFKMGDDVRQDALSLQMIAEFKRIFDRCGLPLYLYPYNTIATNPGGGIMEVVPQARSRDAIGHSIGGKSLHEYFLQRFDGPDSRAYHRVRSNFIQSVAAYSVVSFILQIKDRHNGNILVDEDGHIVHIDFGFVLDIAPGGDKVNFERSPFKLSREMIDIMGGGQEAAPFKLFEQLCVRAYLAVRPYWRDFVALARLMVDSRLPCFKPQSMANLEERFQPRATEREAAAFMLAKINESYGNVSTVIYDSFQAWQNKIAT